MVPDLFGAQRPDAMTDAQTDELAAERANLERIRAVHARHLDRARKTAELLAAEAATATEDGIRDVYDEDAESDAAVAAALVRQTADRAMHAYRRVAELEATGQALAFGRTTDDDGNTVDVGRLSVIDGDEALLVDWRADAALAFYRATPLDPLSINHRRHLLYGDGVTTDANQLEGYSDEVFSIEALEGSSRFRGEAALLAAVSAPTDGQMRSVVATIQAEQDAVIRAPANRPLLVQGGPGTGKTVVALHRAAYLLYDQRASFSESGVLVVGPTNEFLSYIRGVLPSLGETGVVSVTVSKLFPSILLGLRDAPEVAEIKGRAAMVEVLAKAIHDRKRRPKTDLQVWYGSRRVVLPRARLEKIFDRALRHTTHNEGAHAFREDLVAELSAEVYNPSFGNLSDANESFATSVDVTRFLLRHWPPLSPEQALNDLLGSKALLRSAALGLARTDPADSDSSRPALSAQEAESLYRERTVELELATVRWSDADVPLLDELLDLLGLDMANQIDDRDVERDEADEFELAAEAEAAAEAEEEDEIDDDADVSPLLDDDETHRLNDPFFGGRIWYGIDREPYPGQEAG